MLDSDDDLASPGYWPSVADLFMTLFVISIAILAAVFFALLPKASSSGDDAILIAVGKDLQKVREPVNKLRLPLNGKKIDGKEQFLPSIPEDLPPKEVIAALKETCSLAVSRIKELETENKGLRDGVPGYAKFKVQEILEPTNRLLSILGQSPLGAFTDPPLIVEKLERSSKDVETQLDQYHQKHQKATGWHIWFESLPKKVELTEAQEKEGGDLKLIVNDIKLGEKSQVIDDLIKTIVKLDQSSRKSERLLDQYKEKHQKASKWHAWFKSMPEEPQLKEGVGLKLAVKDIKLGEKSQVIDDLIATIEDLGKEIASFRSDKPPIIKLDDGGFKFPPGVATLPPEFIRKLHRQVFPAMKDVLQKYEVVDTLEIVGHTDGVPVGGGKGNMDKMIPQVINNGVGVAKLEAGSNADLGLMRALAIRAAWKQWINQQFDEPKLQRIDIRCYSAGQTIQPKLGQPIEDEPNPLARRIEIRFTQLIVKKVGVEKYGPKKYPVKRIENTR